MAEHMALARRFTGYVTDKIPTYLYASNDRESFQILSA